MYLTTLIRSEEPDIQKMVDEMLLAQKKWLPQYKKSISKLKKKCIYGKSWYLYFSINKSLKSFLNYKSSVAINGVSLTIAKVFTNIFLIVVIPHTLKLTNLKNIKKNDIVNIEIDIIAKYINNLNK